MKRFVRDAPFFISLSETSTEGIVSCQCEIERSSNLATLRKLMSSSCLFARRIYAEWDRPSLTSIAEHS